MPLNPTTAKVALVTGASRRIGAMIAQYLHDAGMNVVLHFLHSEAEAVALCARLNESRPNSACVIQADLMHSEQRKSLIAQTLKPWGRLDVLINNASRFYKTDLNQATENEWDELLDCNAKAPFFLIQAALPALQSSKGCIVNITDIHAERPLRDYAIYCISKSALLAMTKLLAKDLSPNVRVNAVAPGAIIWPEGQNALSAEEKQHIINNTLLKRSGTADDIAKAVLYLAVQADYVTGHVINVDGGRNLCK